MRKVVGGKTSGIYKYKCDVYSGNEATTCTVYTYSGNEGTYGDLHQVGRSFSHKIGRI